MPFDCPIQDCNRSYKENFHLTSHVRHDHGEEVKTVRGRKPVLTKEESVKRNRESKARYKEKMKNGGKPLNEEEEYINFCLNRVIDTEPKEGEIHWDFLMRTNHEEDEKKWALSQRPQAVQEKEKEETMEALKKDYDLQYSLLTDINFFHTSEEHARISSRLLELRKAMDPYYDEDEWE